MRRRDLLLAGAALPLAARAQPAFPDRPLRLVVPFAAGTSSDIQGRLIASRMGETLGQPVVVENRAGGGGTLGAEAVAKARPDGHSLLLGSNGPLTVNPVIQPRMPYDVDTELAPIALVSRSPLTLAVKADSPIRSLAELVAAAKAKPGEITIGSSGQGSATHFLIEQFMAAAGIRLTHVPYRGSSQSIPDLIAGNVQVVMGEVSTTTPVWRGGLVRILATTGLTRSPLVPDVATLIEQGFPGLDGGSWAALMTTGGTPEAAIRTLAAAANAALADPSYQARQAEVGAQLSEAAVRSPAGLAAWLREERARTRATAAQAGIRGE
ncbi:tripartite tricarboxylate transporter substrate binding protein [Paeniroseomonas aquatica]|uniref:Tripartite tricarboxylate transporter substrate binding protein n=1 Tax=Paeniroseomonas aquatica TaxID=373043 RepID=A0ABT8AE65_9PROT|nr:tripartite tricarboxylate transporter substrate binding protein [Paeniroseomonas aquatica]MDN3567838.1 tripartite tricarboxylate transporter substrate binding protein [Paeniroseomonas aquatica]